MAEQVKRTKTKYPNIYYNENTKLYDVKYNYKVYDPLTQKNKYKAKWKYNLSSLAEARENWQNYKREQIRQRIKT